MFHVRADAMLRRTLDMINSAVPAAISSRRARIRPGQRRVDVALDDFLASPPRVLFYLGETFQSFFSIVIFQDFFKQLNNGMAFMLFIT